MYADCIQYTIFNSAVRYKCGTLIFVGGITAFLLVPTVIFALLSESLLMFAIMFREKRPFRFTYGAGQAISNIAFGIYVCCFMTFHSKGLSWLGYKSDFLENKSNNNCKVYRFFYGAILTCMANTSFMDMYEKAIMVRCKCYAPIIKSSSILTLILITISSIVLSLPIYVASNHWIIDGRIICSGDPGWSRITVTILAVHEVAFICGLTQSIGTLILVFSISRDLGKMGNTINFLQTTGLPNQVQTTTADVASLLRMAQRDCWASLVYNGIAALVACFRSICRANLYYAILHEFEDNHTPVGVVEVYASDATEDMTKLMTIALAGFHYWIHFYHIPDARLWAIGDKGKESREPMMQEHPPENIKAVDVISAFNQRMHHEKKSNNPVYAKLSIFSKNPKSRPTQSPQN